MADTKDLKPSGVVDPSKKPNWLDEVRQDAARNTVLHYKRQQEQREFEEAKARGVKVEDIIEHGKKDLSEGESEFAPRDEVETQNTEEKAASKQTDTFGVKKESKEAK